MYVYYNNNLYANNLIYSLDLIYVTALIEIDCITEIIKKEKVNNNYSVTEYRNVIYASRKEIQLLYKISIFNSKNILHINYYELFFPVIWWFENKFRYYNKNKNWSENSCNSNTNNGKYYTLHLILQIRTLLLRIKFGVIVFCIYNYYGVDKYLTLNIYISKVILIKQKRAAVCCVHWFNCRPTLRSLTFQYFTIITNTLLNLPIFVIYSGLFK